jgi:hypothetical protein
MVTRSRPLSLVLGLAGALMVATPAAAGSPVQHYRDSARAEVTTVYYDDDICGPRAGWTEYSVTWHVVYSERPDGSFNFVYGETGTYHTDFDDPSIPDYDSQFTEQQHGSVTAGGTTIWTAQFHDFPGTIRIYEQVVFVDVGGKIQVDRELLRVDGCP